MARSFIQGDRAKIADLRPVVVATLQRVLGPNDAEFEDLVQCSLERLITAVDRGIYRGESPLRVWAMTVTRNIAMDRIRRRIRDRRFFAAQEVDGGMNDRPSHATGPDNLAEMRQLLRKIETALGALPPEGAESLVLHAALGYPLAQVARTLGISISAAQSRMFRARRELLDALLASGDLESRAIEPVTENGVDAVRVDSSFGLSDS
jgi:RNA polymerase sigma factor (sigma-70 family)